MPEINLFEFKNITNAIGCGLTKDAKLVTEANFNNLEDGDACYMIESHLSDSAYNLAEKCVMTIRKKIGDRGSFRLIVSSQAFNELTSEQKKKLHSNCTKYLIFVGAVGKYSIYQVCNDLDCTDPTYEVYEGFTLCGSFRNIESAQFFVKSKIDDEKSSKTLEEALEYVAPPKPPKPSGGII